MQHPWFESTVLAAWQSGVFVWLLRATLLCAVAALVTGLVQKRSADLAHRVWIAALAGVFLLPIITLFLPAWNIQTSLVKLPAASGPLAAELSDEKQAANSIPPQRSASRDLPDASRVVNAQGSSPGSLRTNHQATSTSPALIATPISSTPIEEVKWSRTSTVHWLDLLALLWGTIALVLLCRLFAAIVLLFKLVRHARSAPCELEVCVAEIAASIGTRQSYVVRMLSAHSMPMACWLGRWIVLLPEEIMEWPASLRWTVVAHELGHLARRDAWSDLLTQFVSRVLWPHPLLWLAARAVPRLRERACDEWVLATGKIEQREYAAAFGSSNALYKLAVGFGSGDGALGGSRESAAKRTCEPSAGTLETSHVEDADAGWLLPADGRRGGRSPRLANGA